ncbi:ABC transporter permease [Candidatus Poribacteria bacterium]|nr:ABC transporter permease [Candidatus Poribacteria bacterium]
MYYLRMYYSLISAELCSQMQYKVSFILQFISNIFITFIDFLVILFLLNKFSHIKAWTLWEVGLLYGMTSVSFASAEMLGRGFHVFDKMIRMGTFDRLLIRPVGVFIQVLASEVEPRKLGRFLQGFTVMVISWYKLGIGFDIIKIVFLAAAVTSGMLFFGAILVAGAAICFWTVQGTELPNIITYGGVEVLSYPISIYKEWFRITLIFIIPLAFINYFPALYILDMPDPLGLPHFMRFIFPFVTIIVMLLAFRFWNYGVQHYQSTGS